MAAGSASRASGFSKVMVRCPDAASPLSLSGESVGLAVSLESGEGLATILFGPLFARGGAPVSALRPIGLEVSAGAGASSGARVLQDEE